MMAAAKNVGTSSQSLRIRPDYARPAEPEFNRGRVSGATRKSKVPPAAGFIQFPSSLVLIDPDTADRLHLKQCAAKMANGTLPWPDWPRIDGARQAD